jgi:HlyD family secretion protein
VKASKIIGALVIVGVGLSSLCCSPPFKVEGFLEGEDYLVSTPVPGQVEKIMAKEGDSVSSGEPLASLNAEELRIHLKNAEAALSVVNSELDRAHTVLNRLPKGNPLYSRLKEVYDVGGISKSQLNQAGNAGGDSSLRSQAELLVKELEAQKAKAEAKVEELKALASKTTLTAPAAGMVTKRYIQEGQRLTEGDPAFLITNLTPMYLHGALPEREVGKIKWGQKVQVAPVVLNGRIWVGELIQIENKTEFRDDEAAALADLDSNLRRIKIKVENADGTLKPGMRATATISPSP